jgi:hypothetical protein
MKWRCAGRDAHPRACTAEAMEISGRERAVDSCIAGLVRALNDAGFPTVASCCGHGRQPATIALADGYELRMLTFDQARAVDKMFPPINGGHAVTLERTIDRDRWQRVGAPVPPCEGCGEPANGYSLDDVPLCERCGSALEAEHE